MKRAGKTIVRSTTLFRPLLWIALAVIPSVTIAADDRITDRICILDTGPTALPERRASIAVGCAGTCPTSGLFEWKIELDGKVLESAELHFEGLTGVELKKLKIRGKAKLAGERIIVSPGNSTIRGIPERIGADAVVGSLRAVMRTDAAAQLESIISRRSSGSSKSVYDDIAIAQVRDAVQVNSFLWRHRFRSCIATVASPPTGEDAILIRGSPGGNRIAVMIDSRKGPGGECKNEVLHFFHASRSTGDAFLRLGNRLSSGGCRSEITIFSENNAMHLESGVATWTDAVGDVHPVELKPPIKLPVSVWIAYRTPEAAKEAQTRAQGDLDEANLLYRHNMTGIQFEPHFETWDRKAAAVVERGITTAEDPQCENIPALQNTRFYRRGRLNVYYVDLRIAGRNCALLQTPRDDDCKCQNVEKGDGNISYVGFNSDPATLAHEFGHALGLRPGPCGGHTRHTSNDLPGFSGDNIMGQSENRDYLTLGQVFRMYTYKSEAPDMCGASMLIENNAAHGHPRPCHPQAENDLCPPLRTD